MYDQSTGIYYYNARYYDPEDGRFVSQDTYRGTTKNPSSLHLYTYCYNNPIGNTDPSGHWVYSIGVEAQAAAFVGGYIGGAVNIDSNYGLSFTYHLGVLIVTNVTASIAGFVAGYAKMKSVDGLKGWGISTGVSFACGIKTSANANITVSTNGKMTANACVSFGAGTSIAPVPYFEVKAGYTGGSRRFDFTGALKWKKNKSKTYRLKGMNVVVKRCAKSVRISGSKLKKKFYLYPAKKSKNDKKRKKRRIKKVLVE